MNNLKQKNVIYGRDLKDVLPHSGKGDSVILASNSNITDIRINNIMQQCVNNDLYIENRVAVGMNYQSGPVGVQTESEVAVLPNGSKRWVASDDYAKPLQIFRKIETPLDESIGAVRDVPVIFIASVGDVVFIAFEDRLMYDTGSGLVECKDLDNNTVKAVGYCDGESGTFFVSDRQVYKLVQSPDDINTVYKLKSLNVSGVSGLKCVQYDADNNLIYLGGSNGAMARGHYYRDTDQVQLTSDIYFSENDVYGGNTETDMYITDININAIQTLEGGDKSVDVRKQANIIAATDKGVFRSNAKKFLDVKTAEAFSGKKCVGVVQRNNAVYVLADDGYVYRQKDASGMVFEKYPADMRFESPKALVAHTSGLYVACGDGVHRYVQTGSSLEIQHEYDSQDGADSVFVTSVFNDRMVFVAKGNTVNYYSVAGSANKIMFDEEWSIKQIVVQPDKDKDGTVYLYALEEILNEQNLEENQTNRRISAVCIEFNSQKTIDYDRIDSISLVDSNCESMVCGGGSCYYFKDGVIYNKTTGASARKDDVRVYQMEYLKDDDSIAAATSIGLQVFDAKKFDTKYSEHETKPTDIRFVSQNDKMVCFATANQVFAAAKTGSGELGDTVQVGQIGDDAALADVVIDSDRIYAFGKQRGIETGSISSSMAYRIRQVESVHGDENNEEEPQDEGGVTSMIFPVMSSMTEVNAEAAIGLSGGAAYRLGYSGEDTGIKPVGDFPGASGDVNAFCIFNNRIFAAVGDTVYQYECSADEFDPDDIGDLTLISSQSGMPNVNRLVYSGTDTIFDMRMYATDGYAVSVYVPELKNVEKYTPGLQLDDFIMYIDTIESDESEDEDEKTDIAIVVGLSEGKVYVSRGLVIDQESQWIVGAKVLCELPDITDGDDPHTRRSPYAVFFQDNSRVYIAYTALRADGTYGDYILALDTDDILHVEDAFNVDMTSDFRLLRIADGPSDGRVRFTGFNLPGIESEVPGADNEDIDVLATYCETGSDRVLMTFKVDTNIERSFAETANATRVESERDSVYFQPDCAVLDDQHYIALPNVTADGNDLRIDVYRYVNTDNTCGYFGRASISGVSGIEIKDVFIAGFVNQQDSELDLVVVDSDGKTHGIIARIGQTVLWDSSSSIFGGTPFQRIIRSGINQLVGFDVTGTVIYDFQSRCKYEQAEEGFIWNIYATDTNGKRDYILVQSSVGDNAMYTIEASPDMRFTPVPQIEGDGRKTLLKSNGQVFIIVWDEINKIYREGKDGFELYAEGQFNSRVTGYKDAQICYGVIPEFGYEQDYYLFLLSQPDGNKNCYVDVYAMSAGFGSSVKMLQKISEFESPGVDISFSYISYFDGYSNFDTYTRLQIFNYDRYDWPIVMTNHDRQGEFAFLNFSGDYELRFTELSILLGQHGQQQFVSIAKNDGVAYCVKIDNGKAVICNLSDGAEIRRCDVASTNAWYSGNTCFFQKSGGGVRYYANGKWYDVESGPYDSIMRVESGVCYFLDANTGNLYEGVSVETHRPVRDPVRKDIVYTRSTDGNEFLRLVTGRIYSGIIYNDPASNTRGLCILWPSDRYEYITPDGDTAVIERDAVYVCQASFQKFPDGKEDIKEIVPLGDFLDEIVVYEGGYLHIASVFDRDLVQNKTGMSVIAVVETLPWTRLIEGFESGIVSSVKINGLRYIASDVGLSAFADSHPGLVMKIVSPVMKAGDVNVRQFYKIGQNTFYMSTNRGVYRYQHLNGMPSIGLISPMDFYDVQQIISHNFNSGANTYVMANKKDNFLYESENGRVWKKMFNPVPDADTLNAVYPKNTREWYFGSSSGLYKSAYEYVEVDDIGKFTENDLYDLYGKMLSSDISGQYKAMLDAHELDSSRRLGHLSSLVYDINTKLLSVNFDGLQSSGWQTHAGTYEDSEYSISNDIIFEQSWGSETDGKIGLSVENQFISSDSLKFTYLFKRWMSGITELYVHIPTTNTYYVNHIPSTPDYGIDPTYMQLSAANVAQFGRNKVVFEHDPNKSGVYTTVRLALNKDIFQVDQLLDVQACGNSLPLKIYKETIRENGSLNDYRAAQYFNSYVAPTVLMSKFANEESHVFKFACFGSDEQVIKLQFIDATNRFNNEYCRLVFNSNGLNSDRDSFISQRIRLDGQPYQLQRNQYKWPQDFKLFAGWTFTKNPPDNPNTESLNGFYTDRQQITSTEIISRVGSVAPGQDIEIYAVWITYQFSGNDTTLFVYPSSGKAVFAVDSVSTTADQRLGDKIIVKFEEIG